MNATTSNWKRKNKRKQQRHKERWHGPILGENHYDIFRVGLKYTRMLKMYQYEFIPYNPDRIQQKTYNSTTTQKNNRDNGAYQRAYKLWIIFFNQNKKLIAINNNNKSGRRGAKARHSTLHCRKCYPLLQIGEWIFKSTRMAMYMVGNQKK